jgi:hypothetical protein
MKSKGEIKRHNQAIRRCWILADKLSYLAQDIRYANRPSDLAYPASELLDLVRGIKLFRDKWMQDQIKETP